VRVGAVAEAGIGGVALAHPGRGIAIAVALSYAGFTVFVARALRTDSPLASCGCFGKIDTPPTPGHVAVTAALAAATAVVALGSPAQLALPLLVVSGVLAYVTYLALAVLPLISRRALR
jgi:hypothetical protein